MYCCVSCIVNFANHCHRLCITQKADTITAIMIATRSCLTNHAVCMAMKIADFAGKFRIDGDLYFSLH